MEMAFKHEQILKSKEGAIVDQANLELDMQEAKAETSAQN